MSTNITLDMLASRLRKKPTEHQTSCLLEFSTALRKNSANYLTVSGPLEVPELSQMIAQRTNQLMKDLRSRQDSVLQDPDINRSRNNNSAFGSYSQTTKGSQDKNKPKKKKEPTSNPSEAIAMSKYEQLLKQIIQKEDMLRDVNERLEQRSAELQQLELQYSKKIAASKKEYINVKRRLIQLESTLRKESEKLMDIQHRMLQFEQLFEKKKMEISRGREELQGLLQCVEKIGRENEERTRKLQAQQRNQAEKRTELVNLQRQLDLVRDRLVQDRHRLEASEKDLQQRLEELQTRTDEVALQCQQLTQVRTEQHCKEIELSERDKILTAYVSQLNHCIAMLNVERGGLSQIKTDLANRCQRIFDELENRLQESRNKFTPNASVLQPLDPNRSLTLTNEVYRNLTESKRRNSSAMREPISINLSSVGSMKFSDTGVLVVDSPTELLLDTRVLY